MSHALKFWLYLLVGLRARGHRRRVARHARAVRKGQALDRGRDRKAKAGAIQGRST